MCDSIVNVHAAQLCIQLIILYTMSSTGSNSRSSTSGASTLQDYVGPQLLYYNITSVIDLSCHVSFLLLFLENNYRIMAR